MGRHSAAPATWGADRDASLLPRSAPLSPITDPVLLDAIEEALGRARAEWTPAATPGTEWVETPFSGPVRIVSPVPPPPRTARRQALDRELGARLLPDAAPAPGTAWMDPADSDTSAPVVTHRAPHALPLLSPVAREQLPSADQVDEGVGGHRGPFAPESRAPVASGVRPSSAPDVRAPFAPAFEQTSAPPVIAPFAPDSGASSAATADPPFAPVAARPAPLTAAPVSPALRPLGPAIGAPSSALAASASDPVVAALRAGEPAGRMRAVGLSRDTLLLTLGVGVGLATVLSVVAILPL